MQRFEASAKYYLPSFSNFIAAFGGGMILGKGMDVIKLPYFQGGSLQAFFIGALIGLLFLQFIPKKLSTYVSRWFAIFGGVSSLILLTLYATWNIKGKIFDSHALIFFSLLCCRFSFWFYSRVLRIAFAAGQQQKIALIELGYYLGMILGLIIWDIIDNEINLEKALLLDAIFQFIAGAVDLYVKKTTTGSPPNLKTSHETINRNVQASKKCTLHLASSIVFLTIGIQVVIFSLTHYVTKNISHFMLASFYLGASVSAWLSKKYNFHLVWQKTKKYNNPILVTTIRGRSEFNLLWVTLLAALAVFIVVNMNYWLEINHIKATLKINCLFLAFIFFSAFLYELLALIIIDRIGLEENPTLKEVTVLRTYGMMAISAAMSLWIFDLTQSSFYGLLVALIVSISLSFLNLQRKNLDKEK